LIIEKKDIINLKNIPFLPNIKPLEKINQFLSKTITDNTFEQTIEKILSGMKHENVNVRKLVISNLLDLIKNNQEKIIMNEFLLNTIISNLLSRCATSSDSNEKLLCGECLGALGAIDPSRLSTIETFIDDREEISNIDLACRLLKDYLYKSLIAGVLSS